MHFTIGFLLLSYLSFSQNETKVSDKTTTELPSFKIFKAPDSTEFTKESLAKNKRTIFIVFNPDCGHCQHFTKRLMDSIGIFKKTQIVMVSSVDYSDIKKFYTNYKMEDYPFITVGRDGSYFFITHFEVRQFPSAYVFNKKGKYLKKMVGDIDIIELAKKK